MAGAGTSFHQVSTPAVEKAQQHDHSETLFLATPAADVALYARLAARTRSGSPLAKAVHAGAATKPRERQRETERGRERQSDAPSPQFGSSSPRRPRPRTPEPPVSRPLAHSATPEGFPSARRSARTRPTSPLATPRPRARPRSPTDLV